MLYFFIVLVLLLSGALLATLYTCDLKLKSQKKKLNMLNNQYNVLRKNSISDKSLFNDINLQYSKSPYNYGITSSNIKVYYLPIEKFKTLIEIKEPLELDILEQCVNHSVVWYYVDLKLQNNINSHGWIKKDDFSILRDDYNPMSSNLINRKR